MADFRTAFLRTLAFEDSHEHPGVVTPEPHGGRARLGVNSLAHPELPDSFWTCSYEEALEFAERIFLHGYWAPLKLDSVHDQDIANKVYDIAVNDGVGTAARMLQTALGVKVDGRVGPATLGAVDTAVPSVLIHELRVLNAARYHKLAEENPEEYGSSLENWLARNEK